MSEKLITKHGPLLFFCGLGGFIISGFFALLLLCLVGLVVFGVGVSIELMHNLD